MHNSVYSQPRSKFSFQKLLPLAQASLLRVLSVVQRTASERKAFLWPEAPAPAWAQASAEVGASPSITVPDNPKQG